MYTFIKNGNKIERKIMKKQLSILFIAIMISSISHASNLTPSKNLISLSVNKATLTAVLNLFEKSTDYTVSRPHTVKGTPVSARIIDLPPLDALNQILKGQIYDYIQHKKHIMIYHKNDKLI